jgi:hypothetical protein
VKLSAGIVHSLKTAVVDRHQRLPEQPEIIATNEPETGREVAARASMGQRAKPEHGK